MGCSDSKYELKDERNVDSKNSLMKPQAIEIKL